MFFPQTSSNASQSQCISSNIDWAILFRNRSMRNYLVCNKHTMKAVDWMVLVIQKWSNSKKRWRKVSEREREKIHRMKIITDARRSNGVFEYQNCSKRTSTIGLIECAIYSDMFMVSSFGFHTRWKDQWRTNRDDQTIADYFGTESTIELYSGIHSREYFGLFNLSRTIQCSIIRSKISLEKTNPFDCLSFLHIVSFVD